jgi:hypothetical protein
MPLYEVTDENLNELKETSFELVHLRERFDLQRLLKKQIDVIAPDTLVIAEEFWRVGRIKTAHRSIGPG